MPTHPPYLEDYEEIWPLLFMFMTRLCASYGSIPWKISTQHSLYTCNTYLHRYGWPNRVWNHLCKPLLRLIIYTFLHYHAPKWHYCAHCCRVSFDVCYIVIMYFMYWPVVLVCRSWSTLPSILPDYSAYLQICFSDHFHTYFDVFY